MKNNYKICEDHTILYITSKGKIYECLIDTEDLGLIGQSSTWLIQHIKGGSIYVKNGKNEYLHRIVMGNPDGLVIDHIYHNTLDNRKSQLRAISRGENIRNMKGANRDSKYSGARNVTWHKDKKKWYVRVCCNHKNKCFGYYENLFDAVLAAAYGRNITYKPTPVRVPIKI